MKQATIIAVGLMALYIAANGCTVPDAVAVADADSELRKALKTFYNYQLFSYFYKNFEEREDIVTRDRYVDFIDFAELQYKEGFEKDELKLLIDFYNSDAGKVFRNAILEGHNPLWDFAKSILEGQGEEKHCHG